MKQLGRPLTVDEYQRLHHMHRAKPSARLEAAVAEERAKADRYREEMQAALEDTRKAKADRDQVLADRDLVERRRRSARFELASALEQEHELRTELKETKKQAERLRDKLRRQKQRLVRLGGTLTRSQGVENSDRLQALDTEVTAYHDDHRGEIQKLAKQATPTITPSTSNQENQCAS